MYLKNHNKKESWKVSIKSMKILNGLGNKIMSDQAGIEISVKKENVKCAWLSISASSGPLSASEIYALIDRFS